MLPPTLKKIFHFVIFILLIAGSHLLLIKNAAAAFSRTAMASKDSDGDGYSPDGTFGTSGKKDCNDASRNISPVAREICDGVDNDCDGSKDEGFVNQKTYYRDADSDGYGDPDVSQVSCVAVGGHVTNATDCDDANMYINESVIEGDATAVRINKDGSLDSSQIGVCDNVDNDCDGVIDEYFLKQIFYIDADGDGYGTSTKINKDGSHTGLTQSSCEASIEGYATNNLDCDDAKKTVHEQTTFYQDADGDGYGNAAVSQVSCESSVAGYVADDSDCDDTKTSVLWYFDNDKDGHGSKTVSYLDCSDYFGGAADPDYTETATDCNDYRVDAYDDAPELCDGIDNDCDGDIDEGFATGTLYLDWDKDGYGTPLVAEKTCYQKLINPDGTLVPRTGYSTDKTDCNDGVDTIPSEVACIEDDNACDGTTGPSSLCNTYTVPSDIAVCDGDPDATNDEDVTDELDAWLETVPDGTDSRHSIANLDGKCLAVKGTVELYGRYNITIEGGGGTIKAIDYERCTLCSAIHGGTYTGTTTAEWDTAYAIAAADEDDASYKSKRAQFSIEVGSGFIVKNLTIEGNLMRFSSDGAELAVAELFDPAREKEFNLTLMGPTDVTIDNVKFKNSWSDAVMLSGGNSSLVAWTGINYYATDITIQNSSIDGTGRHALGCAACTNFVVQNNDIRNSGYALIDVELEGSDNKIHGEISLIGNTIGVFRTSLLTASTGQYFDSTLGPFVLQDNVQEEADPLAAGNGRGISIGHDDVPVSSVKITGNKFTANTNNVYISGPVETEVIIEGNKFRGLNNNGIRLNNVANATVTNNTFASASGIAMTEGGGTTTCTNNKITFYTSYAPWCDEHYKPYYDEWGCNSGDMDGDGIAQWQEIAVPFVAPNGCEEHDCGGDSNC